MGSESDRTDRLTLFTFIQAESTQDGATPLLILGNKIPMADVWQKPLQYCNNPPIKLIF